MVVHITQRRYNALYCITGHRDHYRADGLAFMPVYNTGVIFSYLFHITHIIHTICVRVVKG